MQEIAPHVFIETAYPGVTLGALNWPHGLILIDAPFRPDDVRSWRSALLNLGGGVDRMLIHLDAHMDRTLGTRAMECTVLGHEKLLQVFRNRPANFKPHIMDTGSEWEVFNNIGSVRWAPPDLTYSDALSIHWNTTPLNLEYRPGPATGATWAVLPQQNIIFLGDCVVVNQPPFLAHADIPAWLETLEALLSPAYQNHLLVGGRDGLISQNQARDLVSFLKTVHDRLENLAENKGSPEDTESLVPELMGRFSPPPHQLERYRARLRYGLQQYFIRHYRPSAVEDEE